MIRKQQRVVFTFHTTTDAMAMESLCKARSISGRLIPVPGVLSADCGLAWCAEPKMEEILLEGAKSAGIPIQGVYFLMI